MRSELAKIRANLDHMHSALLAVKSELKFHTLMRALKAFTPGDQFNEEQPRDWHGRWTVVGGGSKPVSSETSRDASDVGQVLSIFADIDSVPLSQRIVQLSESEDDSNADTPQPVGATVTYSNAVTGDLRIDGTTNTLTRTLRNVMDVFDFIPYATPRAYGTAVHSAFGAAIKLQNLEGVEVEFSFRNGEEANYGDEGSVRADVALRSVGGEVIAIYDLKTGGATVRQSRADELREHFGGSRYIPVIELHVLRGSRIKHESFQTYFGPRPEAASRLDAVRRVSRCWQD